MVFFFAPISSFPEAEYPSGIFGHTSDRVTWTVGLTVSPSCAVLGFGAVRSDTARYGICQGFGCFPYHQVRYAFTWDISNITQFLW